MAAYGYKAATPGFLFALNQFWRLTGIFLGGAQQIGWWRNAGS
jgi:hypothetical protein